MIFSICLWTVLGEIKNIADLIVIKLFGSLPQDLKFCRGNFQLENVFDFK